MNEYEYKRRIVIGLVGVCAVAVGIFWLRYRTNHWNDPRAGQSFFKRLSEIAGREVGDPLGKLGTAAEQSAAAFQNMISTTTPTTTDTNLEVPTTTPSTTPDSMSTTTPTSTPVTTDQN